MKPIGISFQIGIDGWKIRPYILKQIMGNIRPHIKKAGEWVIAHNGGIRLDFTLGTFRRPIPKFWKK